MNVSRHSPSPTGSSASPPRRASPRDFDDEFGISSKKRKMNNRQTITPSSRSSTASPSSLMNEMTEADHQLNSRAMQHSLTMASFCSADSSLIDSSMTSSCRSSPLGSPSVPKKDYRLRYTKHELWASIESDYQYLMDEEIIETCKSTESDLSWESDDLNDQKKVSFTEFLQQYKELSDWLDSILRVAQRQSSSHSERYLNQSYYEEMLHKSPRKKLFNDYARQLQRRYPSMKEEICARIYHVNNQWQALEAAISPLHGCHDQRTMLVDLEQDLSNLQKWLHDIEATLPQPLTVGSSWVPPQILKKLQEHKAVQQEIESRSKIVCAVLRLCERLAANDDQHTALQLRARSLERHWHTVWLKSLEWQCRLEEALTGNKGEPYDYPVDGAETEDSEWSSNSVATTTTQTDFSANQSIDSSHLSFRCNSSSANTSMKVQEFETSNYDTIPFSENEYEEYIDEKQNESASKDKLVKRSTTTPDLCGILDIDTDPGIDSALGRSVSDNSIPKDNLQLLSHKAVNKAVAYAKAECDKNMRSDPQKDIKRTSPENQDVGYSSEDHSHGEFDYFSESNVNSRYAMIKNNGRLNRSDVIHSYDAQFNNSAKAAIEIQRASSTEKQTFSDRDTSLVSSPNHSFYCMTTIESLTDTEPSSAAERIEIARGDSYEGTDVDSEFSKSLDLSVDELSFDGAGKCIDTIPEGNENSNSPSKFRRDTSYEQTFSEGEKSSEKAMSMSGSGDSTYDLNHVEKTSGSKALSQLKTALNDYLESQNHGSEQSKLGFNSNYLFNDLRYDNTAQDHIDGLIREAKQLVQEKTGKTLQAAKEVQSSLPIDIPKSSLRNNKRFAPNDSFTSTDGSFRQTDDACDASAEGSGSESENEFSTASSDREEAELHPELTSCNTTISSTTGGFSKVSNPDFREKSRSQASSPVKKESILSSCSIKSKGIRPQSMIDLHTTSTYQPMFSRLSLSEGAIHDLYSSVSFANFNGFGKSDSFGSDSRKQKRRKFRRTKSDESQHQTGHHSGRTSPISRPLKSNKSERNNSLETQNIKHSTPLNCRTASNNPDNHGTHTSKGKSLFPGTNTGPGRIGLLSSESEVHTPLNSNVESSEQAWDNYQLPPYTSVSEDPNEEKLDASHLGGEWEHNLDFEEDFHLDSRFGCGLKGVSERKSTQPTPTEQKSGTYFSAAANIDESDSDLEDFRDVVEESHKAIQFTQSTLRKQHKDPMGTGILYDPSEYSEPLATCHTNIKCLEEVVITLQTEQGMTNVGDDDIHEVLDMIADWKKLEGLARTRLAQSQALATMYNEIRTNSKAITAATEMFGKAHLQFNCITDLEDAIKALQHMRQDVCLYKDRLEHCQEVVGRFTKKHPALPMHQFEAILGELIESASELVSDTNIRARNHQTILLAWQDLIETEGELSYLLAQERQQLSSKQLAQPLSVAELNPEEAEDMLHDLQLLKSELDVYEEKLTSLRSLYKDIKDVATEPAQTSLASHIACLDSTTYYLKQCCNNLASTLEKKIASASSNKDEQVKCDRKEEVGAEANPRPGRFLRTLKATLPGQVAMAAMVGMMYLMDPQDTGLIFAPELRYVRGPPPT